MPASSALEVQSPGLRSFNAFGDAAGRAHAAAGGAVDRHLELGGARIRLRFAGPALAELLLPALEHAARPPAAAPDVTLDVWDSATTGVQAPRFPWRPRDVRERGEIAGFNDDRVRTLFHGDLLAPEHDFRAVSTYDRGRGHGVLWVLSPRRVPWWERAAPLRTLLHWALARPPERLLLHAAAVGAHGRGLLLAGAGGSGKSTTAVACLASGLTFAGDDYVLLDTSGAPIAHPVYGTAKLEPRSLGLLGDIGRAAWATEGVDGEKRVVDLARRWPDRTGCSVPIHALVVPRVSHGAGTRLRAASGAEALRALAPTTIFQLPGRNGAALRPLADLARNLPTYLLELAGPPREAATLLGRLLRGEE